MSMAPCITCGMPVDTDFQQDFLCRECARRKEDSLIALEMAAIFGAMFIFFTVLMFCMPGFIGPGMFDLEPAPYQGARP